MNVNTIDENTGNNIQFDSDVSFLHNVHITGNLVLDGSLTETTVNTTAIESERIEVTNAGNNDALIINKTSGTGNVASFAGSDGSYVEIGPDSKTVFYKDVSINTHLSVPDASFTRIGAIDNNTLIVTDDLSVNGDIFSTNFDDLSGKHYSLSGTVDGFEQSIATTDLSVNSISVKSGNIIQFSSEVSFNQHVSGTDASFSALSVSQLMGYSPIEVMHDLSLNQRLIAPDASFGRIGAIDDSLAVMGDLSVNGTITLDKLIFPSAKTDVGINNSLGIQGTAVGNGNITGPYSTAVGHTNDASGIASSVFGWENSAIGDDTVAIGYNTTANDSGSIAIGYHAKASDGKMYFGISGCEDASSQIFFDNCANKMRLNCPGDISLSGNIYQNGTLFQGGGGGSGTDASFDRIAEFTDGSGITFLNDVSINGNIFANNLSGSLRNFTLFNNAAGANNSFSVVSPVIFYAGTTIFHNVKVSGFVDYSGVVNWPDGGHEYILKRTVEGSNTFQEFEKFKYIFDARNIHEETNYTFVEKITADVCYNSWKIDISGDKGKIDASDNLTWDVTVISPQLLSSSSSSVANYTPFDLSAASDVSTNTTWTSTSNVPINANSLVFHNIKVSGYLTTGYIDWPMSGHEFIFQRSINGGASYTWDSSKDYEEVKYIFISQDNHEEVTYTILEKVPNNVTYNGWKCDISGDGARTDSTDKLTWEMTVITPSDYLTVNPNSHFNALAIGASNAKNFNHTFDVSGTSNFIGHISANDASFGTIDASGDIRATGDITAFYTGTSDARLKTNICNIEDHENIIMNVRGVRFNWNETAQTIGSNVDLSKVEIGVIAQEIEEYIPEIIKDGLGNYKAVRYEKIVPILIECMKDLYQKTARIPELEKRIAELEKKLE